MENTNTGIGSGSDSAEKEHDGIHKIAITKESERALVGVIEKVNDGYNGGRATRQGVASWIIMQFAKTVAPHDIKAMRLEFLNEISLLELALRRSKDSGKLSPELKKLLMQQMGLLDEPARRLPKVKGVDDNAPSSPADAA